MVVQLYTLEKRVLVQAFFPNLSDIFGSNRIEYSDVSIYDGTMVRTSQSLDGRHHFQDVIFS